MKITRDVITDLLPVYLSGEASEDTKALVDTFLKDDPEFSKLVRENGAILPESQINLSKENEMDTLLKTQKLLRQRSTYMAFTILFTLLPLSFYIDAQGMHWMWTDTPINAAIFAGFAIIFGFQYWRISQKLKGSDL
ncbi:MAG TPA: hypothetical protein PLF18_12770 [Anaerolineales bacterium]|nr:hypothetical protein [Anaerolineales bacterium]